MKRLNVLSKSASVLLTLTMLSACASPPKVRTTEAACTVLKPIEFHLCPAGELDNEFNECDTPETATRVDAYNRDLAALCPAQK